METFGLYPQVSLHRDYGGDPIKLLTPEVSSRFTTPPKYLQELNLLLYDSNMSFPMRCLRCLRYSDGQN